jgi:hypothetical protein
MSLPAQAPPSLTAVRFSALVDGTGRVVRDAVVTNGDTIVAWARGRVRLRGAIDLRRSPASPG